MTKDAFNQAKDLMSDIKSLKNIQCEFNDRHWVSFYGAVVKEQSVISNMLKDDLKVFVTKEIEKLEKEFEKL